MAEYQIAAVCTITDPEQRRRRLAQVYDLLLGLGREKQTAKQEESGELMRGVVGDVPIAGGE